MKNAPAHAQRRKQTVRFPLTPAARNPVAVPWAGRIGVRLDHLRLFDPDTLRESDVPQDLPGPGEPLSAQWISADKQICGFAGEGFAHLFRPDP